MLIELFEAVGSNVGLTINQVNNTFTPMHKIISSYVGLDFHICLFFVFQLSS